MIYSIRFRRRGVGNSKHLPAVVSDPSHNPVFVDDLRGPASWTYTAQTNPHTRDGPPDAWQCLGDLYMWNVNQSSQWVVGGWETHLQRHDPQKHHYHLHPTPKGGSTSTNAFFWKNLTFVSKLLGNPYFLPPIKIGFPHAIRRKLWPIKTSRVQLAVWECFRETSSSSLNNIYWNPCFSNITGFLPCSKYSRYHAQTITSAWGCKRKSHCLSLIFHWLAGLILFSRQRNKHTMDVYI